MEIKKQMNRQRLHSLIYGAMRYYGLPADLEGYVLIRETVFEKIDHPTYDMKNAVLKAMKMAQLPSRIDTYEDAINMMFYCIEESSIRDEEFVNKKVTKVTFAVIEKICKSVWTDYNRIVAIETLKSS